ncbi:hypothetical protein LIER_13593 [Lithospermum erythrorhizon]|uniref:Uncharacterized protein n=1 Tax=Lithospermum erythrorhizon TaxID=34254 RepID=A0AAV3PVZ6_LITER
MKFLVSNGEGILRSEQRIALESYLNSMKPVETKRSNLGDPTKEPLGTDYEYSIKVEKEDLSSSDDERRKIPLKNKHKKVKHVNMLEILDIEDGPNTCILPKTNGKPVERTWNTIHLRKYYF